MVGIVVVSHSRPLARAAVGLASEMIRDRRVRIAIAAGLDETTTGTDAVAVADAIMSVDGRDGVVVLLDLGSAVLSAELALELLPDETRDRVILSAAPLVEGLVTAVVTAAGGADAAEVAAEAANALADKRSHLGVESVGAPDPRAAAVPAAGGSPVAPAPEPAAGVAGGEGPPATLELVVDIPHGLHARPAARVVSAVRDFDAVVTLARPGGDPVPARSLSRISALGVRSGERLQARATGPQAAEALAALRALADRHFDDGRAAPGPASGGTPDPESGADARSDAPAAGGSKPAGASAPGSPPAGGDLPAGVPPRRAVTVLAGLALAPATRLGRVQVAIPDSEPGTTAQRLDRLRAAVAAVAADLRATFGRTRAAAGGDAASIFAAHLALLEDPEIVDAAYAAVAGGSGPAAAWDAAVRAAEQGLSRLDDDYLRARAQDVRAVGDAVLLALLGSPQDAPAEAGAAAGIVLAADLTPSQAALLDPARVLGVVLAGGSPTAHAAILVRSLGIPMLVGAGPQILTIAAGTPLALDAGAGTLAVDPDEATVTALRARIAADADRAQLLRQAAGAPAVTSDGTPVEVTANIGSVADAVQAAAAGADGSGLVRTEFCFTGRQDAPGADEQEQIYEDIAAALHPHRVVFRTMDVGGDKPLAFLAMPAEANPFLGVRGLRISLLRRDLLRDQLAAILAVARRYPVSVMFPMVTTVEELLAARAVLDEVAAAGGGVPDGLRVGMMVEVPGAAVKAASFAPHVDFFSIGTNDLTQYTLAAERGNDALTGLADALDPGVLGLISLVCRGAAARPGEPVHVAVCGEAAADPAAVAILLGLGVRELSVAAPAVASVKDRVRRTDVAAAARLAAAALTDPGAAAVRARVAAATTDGTLAA